jgi:regulator of protease activity HflC (stomatin/prohibitin superfamily)
MVGPAEPDMQAVARVERTLLRGAGGALVLAIAALGGQYLAGYGALAPVAVFLFLVASAFYVVGRVTRLRTEESRPPDDDRETAPAEPEHPRAEEGARPKAAGDAQRVAGLFSVAGAVGLGLTGASFWGDLASGPAGRTTLLAGMGLGLLAFLLMVASRALVALLSPLPESAALAEWLRGAQWVSALTGAGLLARGLGLESVDLGRWVAVLLLAGCALCAAELWMRGLAYGFGSPAARVETGVPLRLITLTALVHGGVPLRGLAEIAEQRLGLSLRSAWAIGFVRRSLGALLASLIGLIWLSTMLVVIGPQEQGLRLRFGRLAATRSLGPGVHLKWPWPVETVDRYVVTRVQTVGLGYAGPPRDSLLWARTHAGEEYQLLLGDGRELLSVDATISYRIRDVLAFAFGSQNTQETLEGLAYRLLMRETVASNLDRLLTADRAELGRRFTAALQQASDGQGLGLEILHVGFISLHPPVGIAGAYEDVVSAEIDGETRVGRGRVYQETALPNAQAGADRQIREAEAEASRRLADAEGAAARFRAALSAAHASPELFRFRRRLEALEAGLADRRLFVIDHRLRAVGGELWIDARTEPPPAQELPPPASPPPVSPPPISPTPGR